ncbi:Hypothetical protein NTJ_14580 [Nesidiocoris tenuis]|uniref:Uncharacterized protein n=1 Tax=Nesidiocoris tenuis TaxID=355587 RepID=A0ABN7BDK1_9HEMI|nr:Hypothetical protein NTJ_14580 [Nesidiocoris tenuis]
MSDQRWTVVKMSLSGTTTQCSRLAPAQAPASVQSGCERRYSRLGEIPFGKDAGARQKHDIPPNVRSGKDLGVTSGELSQFFDDERNSQLGVLR